MKSPDRQNGNGLFFGIERTIREQRHRRIALRIAEPFVDFQTLIDFVATASYGPSERDRHYDDWRTWADRFFPALIERRGDRVTPHLPLQEVASRFSPRRYALMVEMLGVHATERDRSMWLPDIARPFLDVHRDEPFVQEAFLKFIGVSSIPKDIKGDMMRKLKDYENGSAPRSGTVFPDTQTRPPGPEGQT